MTQVAAGDRHFKPEDLVHEFVVGACLGMAGPLVAEILRTAAVVIRSMVKVFGKDANEIADLLTREADRDDPSGAGGAADAGAGDAGGATSDEFHGPNKTGGRLRTTLPPALPRGCGQAAVQTARRFLPVTGSTV